MLKCIIIEDEPSGRKIIEEFIAETDFLQLAGQAPDPVKALPILNSKQIDLIFLDVQMPKMNGIDFLRSFKNPPMVILTTAFPEYAIQGFEMDVIDYLLKPVSFERFLKASAKALEFQTFHAKSVTSKEYLPYFFVKSNYKYEKVLLDELLFVEAANNYVLFHFRQRRLIAYITFRGIEEQLPSHHFIKVHKSFMVALDKIDSIDGEQIRIGEHHIPISRTMRDEVMERIVNKNLIKR